MKGHTAESGEEVLTHWKKGTGSLRHGGKELARVMAARLEDRGGVRRLTDGFSKSGCFR